MEHDCPSISWLGSTKPLPAFCLVSGPKKEETKKLTKKKQFSNIFIAHRRRRVRQSSERIQENKSIAAFCPLRCTVADRDHFLGKRAKNAGQMECTAPQMTAPWPGTEKENTTNCISLSRLNPDLVILCFLFRPPP